jgi:hypothetical protein
MSNSSSVSKPSSHLNNQNAGDSWFDDQQQTDGLDGQWQTDDLSDPWRAIGLNEYHRAPTNPGWVSASLHNPNLNPNFDLLSPTSQSSDGSSLILMTDDGPVYEFGGASKGGASNGGASKGKGGGHSPSPPSSGLPPPPPPPPPNSTLVGAAGGLQIDLIWDSSVSSAPSGFESAAIAAATEYTTMFSNPETITINVGYGEVGGSAIDAGSGPEPILRNL